MKIQPFSLLLLLIVGCDCNYSTTVYEPNQKQEANPLYTRENAILFEAEQKEIQNYIKKSGLKFISVGDGSFISVTKRGKGEKAEKQRIISLSYKLKLLNDSICEASSKTEPMEFIIGSRTTHVGLDRLVEHLYVGDKATIILPHYLAFGVRGAYEKIPLQTPVIYEIEVLGLRKIQKERLIDQ